MNRKLTEFEQLLIKKYVGELKGLKAIGKEIHKDPRTFKHFLTDLGFKIPHPGSIWRKAKQHFEGEFYKPIPKHIEEIIIGSLLGDAQIRLQSKTIPHENNPTEKGYIETLETVRELREKAKKNQFNKEQDINKWNEAIELIKSTNTASLRFHKSILELEWVKALDQLFNPFFSTTSYVKKKTTSNKDDKIKWTCGFDSGSSIQLFNLWKEWYLPKGEKNIKIIPKSFKFIPSNALLHWFTGDGQFTKKDISLFSLCFTLKENNLLISHLKLLRENCWVKEKRKKY